jgi:hypothetical protein
MHVRRWAAGLLLAGVLLAIAAPAALADGDPASDILPGEDVFLPYGAAFSQNLSPADKQVVETVAESKRAGYPIKVAVISSKFDLGAITALMSKPNDYARFLGQELTYVWKGPLLIVMPNGFGFWNYGRPASRERQVLRTVTIPRGASGLSQAASAGVAVLAGAAGHPIKVPSLQSGGGFPDRLVIAAVGAALLVLMAVLTVVWRRRRPRGQSHPHPEEG